MLAGCVAVLVSLAIRRSSEIMKLSSLVIGATLAVDLLMLEIGHGRLVGYVALSFALVMFVPQARNAIRGDLAGVSVTSWILILASTISWVFMV